MTNEQLAEIKTHPVQIKRRAYDNLRGSIRTEVSMAAYEVYSHVYGAQEELITGGCRGGFSTGELIAFLYAKGFPKSEWPQRVDEAFEGMDT